MVKEVPLLVYENDDDPDNHNFYPEGHPKHKERIFVELKKGSSMPVRYLMFVKEEKTMWPWLLVIIMGCSALFGYIGLKILGAYSVECAGTRSCCTVFFVQHCVNFVVGLLCFFKAEIKWGNGWCLFGVMLFDIVVLAWGNVTFF